MRRLSQVWKLLSVKAIAYLAIAIAPAYAQVQETTYDIGENCHQLPKFGADSLSIHFKWDSDSAKPAQAFLLGTKGDQLIWKRQFPWEQGKGFLNPAKSNSDCQDGAIRLYSQIPFSAFTYIQIFRWENQQLSYISSTSEDPSAEAVDRMIEQVAKGNNDIFKDESLSFFYPHRYIYGAKLAEAIALGHKVSFRLYHQGNAPEAALRLKSMFNLTVTLTEIIGKSSQGSEPQKWVETWKDMEVDPNIYVAALNDYGFFLQEMGNHQDAIPIFQSVIASDRDRNVAYLNLGDSLWVQGQIEQAKQSYRSYQQLMIKGRMQRSMPSRVKERLS
jgi:tetratricopeptide (TPR) repeat protein